MFAAVSNKVLLGIVFVAVLALARIVGGRQKAKANAKYWHVLCYLQRHPEGATSAQICRDLQITTFTCHLVCRDQRKGGHIDSTELHGYQSNDFKFYITARGHKLLQVYEGHLKASGLVAT